MELRPYQEEAVKTVFSDWSSGKEKTILVMATGTGKTVVFSKIAEECVRQGKKVLILAHRRELLDQAADKIKKSTGLDCAVECASEFSIDSWNRIVVGSIQTLMRDKRLQQFSPTAFDVIIVDECHHILSDSYQKVLNYFSNALVLGVTATADRADKKQLGSYFDSCAFEYNIANAIRDGYLSPIKTRTIPLDIDLNTVNISAGDFNAGDLGRALDPYLEQIADQMAQYCFGRKTVVFLPLINTSQRFTDMLIDRGFCAEEINGQSKDRTEKLERFEKGKTNVLCNSMLLTEGWDCPSVDCIVCLRPTKSRSLYVQIVGRGTRLHQGKDHLLLLDFLWHHERHQLCRPAHILAKDDIIAQKASELAAKGDLMDIEALDAQAEKDVLQERENALIEELRAQRKKKASLVDPLQFEFSIRDSDLASYVPEFGWQCMPVSDTQKATIEKFGVYVSKDMTQGKASLLIDRLIKRTESGLSTAKQIRTLEQRGFKDVGMWTIEQASKMIARISAAGWRIPKGVTPSKYKPV